MGKSRFDSVTTSPKILGAIEGLDNLLKYDKNTCLEKLEIASDTQMWDVLLKGQANLFFNSESSWLAKQLWWEHSKNILEIGSGNGSFLHLLSNDFQEKIFCGVEKLSEYVEKANAQYAADNLTFQKGDAGIYDRSLEESADIVFFRVTLQHLENSNKALKNASDYLVPNGHVVIIESFDKAHKDSPSMSAIDEAMLLAYEQKSRGYGNRIVSFELLQAMNSGITDLVNTYEIAFSNIDIHGNIIFETTRFEGNIARLRYFNHILLLLTMFQRIFHIPVNLDKAYDELQVYLRDENAWTRPGVHFLVLKKKEKLFY